MYYGQKHVFIQCKSQLTLVKLESSQINKSFIEETISKAGQMWNMFEDWLYSLKQMVTRTGIFYVLGKGNNLERVLISKN